MINHEKPLDFGWILDATFGGILPLASHFLDFSRCGTLEQHVPNPSELSEFAVAIRGLASTSRCLVDLWKFRTSAFFVVWCIH